MAKFLGFEFGKKTEQVVLNEVNVKEKEFAYDFGFSTNSFIPNKIDYNVAPNGYVKYGSANDFPDTLIDLYNSSPVHSSSKKPRWLSVMD